MPAPTPYHRSFNFTTYQAANPASPLPGNEVDAELNAVVVTTAALIANLSLIQNSTGTLANQSVGYEQLKPALIAGGINTPTRWAAGVQYSNGDTVFFGAQFYVVNTPVLSSALRPPSLGGAYTLLVDFSTVTLTGSDRLGRRDCVGNRPRRRDIGRSWVEPGASRQPRHGRQFHGHSDDGLCPSRDHGGRPGCSHFDLFVFADFTARHGGSALARWGRRRCFLAAHEKGMNR